MYSSVYLCDRTYVAKGDRDDLDLQGGQLELLQAVSAVAKKTVVILVHGRPQTFGPGNAVLVRLF